MKKLGLITLLVCGLSTAAVSIYARNYESADHPTFAFLGWRTLSSEINHLNRMRGHVRWQLGYYRAGAQLRREFARVSHEIDHINWEFRNGSRDPRDRSHLQREVENAHAELHRIEVDLHVRARDYYSWR